MEKARVTKISNRYHQKSLQILPRSFSRNFSQILPENSSEFCQRILSGIKEDSPSRFFQQPHPVISSEIPSRIFFLRWLKDFFRQGHHPGFHQGFLSRLLMEFLPKFFHGFSSLFIFPGFFKDLSKDSMRDSCRASFWDSFRESCIDYCRGSPRIFLAQYFRGSFRDFERDSFQYPLDIPHGIQSFHFILSRYSFNDFSKFLLGFLQNSFRDSSYRFFLTIYARHFLGTPSGTLSRILQKFLIRFFNCWSRDSYKDFSRDLFRKYFWDYSKIYQGYFRDSSRFFWGSRIFCWDIS